jgi:hypothetical protein
MGALDGMTGTSSFASVAFWQVTTDASVTRPGRTARVEKQGIPYGNSSTVQVGGYDIDDLQITAMLKDTDWPLLAALVGESSTLQLLGDVARTCVLAGANDPRFLRDGVTMVSLRFTT